MQSSKTITVIVCTYNRGQRLRTALESLLDSVVAPGTEWEILVVDNNSSDDTKETVGSLRKLHPNRIRYVFEAKQGLSNARNCGIDQARGQVIAFTDDDVTVDPGWLQNLTALLFDDRFAGAGGLVLPHEGFVQPDWLVMDGGMMDSSGVLALFNNGTCPGELNRPPFGANMAFRKAIFEKHGGFRPELGRCGESLIGNEDTEFGARLMAAGESLWYEPAAVVYHPVSEVRLSKRYFLRWWFSYGRAIYRQAGARPAVFGIPRAYFSVLSRAARWLSSSPRDARTQFYWKCRLWVAAGEVAETLRGAGKPDQKKGALVA